MFIVSIIQCMEMYLKNINSLHPVILVFSNDLERFSADNCWGQ